MSEVAAYEAKTHFSALLDRVADGERITITRHGQPVAVLAPATAQPALTRADALVAARTLRAAVRATAAEVCEWTQEGRD